MYKQCLCFIACVFLLGSFLAVAKGGKATVSLSPGEEFYIYGKDNKVAAILGVSVEELGKKYEAENMVYLAVNSDNTKQIRVSVFETAFSENVGNLSVLSKDKITTLIPQLTGGTRGEIVDKDGQKFIKEQWRSSDSGGDYLFTRYATVAAKKVFLLSFYTAAENDTDYIETVFQSYNSTDFIQQTAQSKGKGYRIILPVAVLLLCAISGFLVVTLIRDIRQ